MLTGNKIIKSEGEYRETMLDSSSSLKIFSQDRRKYFRIFIEGNKDEEDNNKATAVGRMVECLLLEPENFDNKFYLSACVSAPSGNMLSFVEALYTLTRDATGENGTVNADFQELMKEAYLKSGYKIAFERVVNTFSGGDAEIYYNEIRTVRSKGLLVVTADDVGNAEKIAEELKVNEVTKDILSLTNSARYSVYNQLQLENFEIEGLKMKGMMDLVHVDHLKKTIQIYDLKCVWNVEGFYWDYYLYRRAYIQAFVYWKACKIMTRDKNHEWYDYEVLPPMFIVCDSINYYNPLIYKMTYEDLKDAKEGFEYRGIKYTGTKEVIEDLKWALENNIWRMSRKNDKNMGIVNLKP